MHVSSGTVSLFASVVIAMASAVMAAYMLKHPDQVRVFMRAAYAQAGIPLAAHGNPGREHPEAVAAAPGTVTLNASRNGHFETEAEVNGHPIDVMVDTGATLVALSYEDAERAGIFLRPADFTHTVSTANGSARVAIVAIDSVSVGDITVHNVQGAVSEPGRLQRTLLGMSFLGRLSRIDMRSDSLLLQE